MGNTDSRGHNLAGHESRGTQRGFMIEQYSRARMQTVGLAIVGYCVVRCSLGGRVGAPRVEWSFLGSRDRRVAETFAGTGIVEADRCLE